MSTPPAVRASDADRERTAGALREHCAAGRLTPEELSERLDVAYAARTVAELDATLRDLPPADAGPPAASSPRSPARVRARERVLHAVGFAVLVTTACVTVWLATGADGSFWPKWVLLASAIRLAFVGWGELGPAGRWRRDGTREEARLGRGGARERALPPGERR